MYIQESGDQTRSAFDQVLLLGRWSKGHAGFARTGHWWQKTFCHNSFHCCHRQGLRYFSFGFVVLAADDIENSRGSIPRVLRIKAFEVERLLLPYIESKEPIKENGMITLKPGHHLVLSLTVTCRVCCNRVLLTCTMI